MVCGWATQLLESKKNWDKVHAYRAVFFGYALLGLIKLGLTIILSSACEVDGKGTRPRSVRNTSSQQEDAPLLGESAEGQDSKKGNWLGFSFRKDSLVVLAEVCFLLALEAISMGLIVT